MTTTPSRSATDLSEHGLSPEGAVSFSFFASGLVPCAATLAAARVVLIAATLFRNVRRSSASSLMSCLLSCLAFFFYQRIAAGATVEPVAP